MTESLFQPSSQQQLIIAVLALVGFVGSLIIAVQVLRNATRQFLGGVSDLATGLFLLFLGGGVLVLLALLLWFFVSPPV